jgi:hypothetical protein
MVKGLQFDGKDQKIVVWQVFGFSSLLGVFSAIHPHPPLCLDGFILNPFVFSDFCLDCLACFLICLAKARTARPTAVNPSLSQSDSRNSTLKILLLSSISG